MTVPEDKYDWRLAAGGESSFGRGVLDALASANYFFAMINGAQLPEGINPQEMEKTVTGKDNIIEAVKKSYDFIVDAGKATPDAELGDEITYPTGDKFSKRTNLLIASGHCSEHMGQLIAYARTNGIAPPWSASSE